MPKPKTNSDAPLVPRDRVLVAMNRKPANALRMAREFGVGVEVQTFANPDAIVGYIDRRLTRMAKRLADVQGPIGCHGPFLDTVHYSLDPDIAEIAWRRYAKTMLVADKLGAQFAVFHSQYNPMIKNPGYPDLYHGRNLGFWPDILEDAERWDVAVYLENMFDDSPEPLRRLAEAFDSPYLKLCLDPAHVVLYSDAPMSEWVDAYRPYLAHVHLSDCNGQFDDHLGLGKGTVDLPGLFALLSDIDQPLTYALETGRYTRASLRYLGIEKL